MCAQTWACILSRKVTLTADWETTLKRSDSSHPSIQSISDHFSRKCLEGATAVLTRGVWGADLGNAVEEREQRIQIVASRRSVQYPRETASVESAMRPESESRRCRRGSGRVLVLYPRCCRLHPVMAQGVRLCRGYITSHEAERRRASSPNHSRTQTHK